MIDKLKRLVFSFVKWLGFEKIPAFLFSLLSTLFGLPTIFFNFYFIFIYNKKVKWYEHTSMYIILGCVACGLSFYHKMLNKKIDRNKANPIKCGFFKGLKNCEITLYITLAFYFTTKTYSINKLLLYLASLTICFFLSKIWEGISFKFEGYDYHGNKLPKKGNKL